jgi:2',3'-cyclic-nucleotide 2'-phosphodiesterase (5'-nucleotidase family)
MLAPYKDSVEIALNKVIGFSVNGLYKKLPESGLGNFAADCMLAAAQSLTNKPIDAAIINSGSIRSYIPKGDITVKKIYEVFPYDNLIVVQEIKGNILKTFLDKIAENGGGALAGATMQIKDGKAVNITISGKILDDSSTYLIAILDFIATNENFKMLKNLPQQNTGRFFRDAIVQYIMQITESEKPIDAKTEKRVTYAN